jgi:hypothetical protein
VKTQGQGVTLATVRRKVLGLPGVEDGVSYGMPSFKVAGDRLLEHEPEVFFTTDHYRNYPTVLIHLARVTELVLDEVLMDAWRRVAPRRLVKEHDEKARKA